MSCPTKPTLGKFPWITWPQVKIPENGACKCWIYIIATVVTETQISWTLRRWIVRASWTFKVIPDYFRSQNLVLTIKFKVHIKVIFEKLCSGRLVGLEILFIFALVAVFQKHDFQKFLATNIYWCWQNDPENLREKKVYQPCFWAIVFPTKVSVNGNLYLNFKFAVLAYVDNIRNTSLAHILSKG